MEASMIAILVSIASGVATTVLAAIQIWDRWRSNGSRERLRSER